MKVPPQIQKTFDYVDALSIRERGMVVGTVLVLLWATWDSLLMQPLRAVETARQEQLTSLSSQLVEITRTIQMLASGQSSDPDQDARRSLAEIRTANIEVDAELRTALRELVEPREMASLLESMLVETGNLALVRMNTLPAQPIAVDDEDTGYFRHGLTLEVRGSYLDTLRYLQALEQLRWKFLWDSVQIEVTEHPMSTITITVFTLGRRPGSIGV